MLRAIQDFGGELAAKSLGGVRLKSPRFFLGKCKRSIILSEIQLILDVWTFNWALLVAGTLLIRIPDGLQILEAVANEENPIADHSFVDDWSIIQHLTKAGAFY